MNRQGKVKERAHLEGGGNQRRVWKGRDGRLRRQRAKGMAGQRQRKKINNNVMWRPEPNSPRRHWKISKVHLSYDITVHLHSAVIQSVAALGSAWPMETTVHNLKASSGVQLTHLSLSPIRSFPSGPSQAKTTSQSVPLLYCFLPFVASLSLSDLAPAYLSGVMSYHSWYLYL